nr:LysR substrate-binding domain-containing protein [Erysipelothrix larvae]
MLPSDSTLAHKETITRNDILDQPLLIPKRYKLSKDLAQWFQCDIATLNVVATINLTTNAVIMVENKMGLATVIGGSFLGDENNNVCFRPFYPKVARESILAWKKY